MLQWEFEAPPSDGIFCQTIRLKDGDTAIGLARWQAGYDDDDGLAQILEFTIIPTHRRQGHGRRMMDTLFTEAKKHYASRTKFLRRAWVPIHQESQIIARAFLMKFGFHHVGTLQELLFGEDMLLYMRTFN